MDTSSAEKQFLEALHRSIEDQNFVKLTLSKPIAGEEMQNVYGKLIRLKKGLALSCTLRYPKKDMVQNYLLGEELDTQLQTWIGKVFKIATLLTATETLVLQFNKKGEAQLQTQVAQAQKAVGIAEHNKEKNYLIAEQSRFLQLLGICSGSGKVLQGQQDKFRQINKYAEIMQALLAQQMKKEGTLRIVDMGSGKGYLTFALYDLLHQTMQWPIELLGIELRAELCNFCNEQATVLGWEKGLRFAAMDIMQYEEGDIDVLIALHACDIATDIAIAQGIKNGAAVIVVAPCCHKQIRKEIKPQGPWTEVLKHGILLERQAELLTDAIRARILEMKGYKTKVFEFISTEHTPKNVMITAVKSTQALSEQEKADIAADIAALKAAFGIGTHYLEQLLK